MKEIPKVILVQIDPDYEPELGSALADVCESLRFHEIPAVITETDLPPAKAKELCLKALDRLVVGDSLTAEDREQAIEDAKYILKELANAWAGLPEAPETPEGGASNVTIITPEGETKRLRCADTGLKALQKLVGGYIEVVPELLYRKGTRRGEDVVLVNEEGRLRNLPVNWTAMGALDTVAGAYGELYGNVVIIDKHLLNKEGAHDDA